jgi:hypothetical protein
MPFDLPEQTSRFLSSSQKTALKKALGRSATWKRANEVIGSLTGISGFFTTEGAWQAFRAALATNAPDSLQETALEYGDFQTPLSLAKTVCEQLSHLGYRPTTLVEPTCGRGNFVIAALSVFPTIQTVYGLEIQENYVTECKSNLLAQLLAEPQLKRAIHIKQGNIFTDGFPPELLHASRGPVLVLGNPPWVTNTALSALNSSNLPSKSNFKGHSGLDAMTGKSNFDIAEFILLQLIRNFAETEATIAMLCKNIVIRNLIEATKTQGLPITNVRAFTFDAAKEFDVACDASLFVADLTHELGARTCSVSGLQDNSRQRVFGWSEDHFVADVSLYSRIRHIEGISPIVWRQGIKHDCSAVMELDCEEGKWRNGLGQPVDIECDRVFPLAKGSDLKPPVITRLRKAVIVPQSAIGEDTIRLKRINPQLWEYLSQHAAAFAARKSSIYKDKPPFSIFGVGDYSFKPYKVAMSGLYKSSTFSLLMPINGKPVMLDDTGYLLGFETLGLSAVALALLNSELVQDFLKSIVFPDSKRPYTKDVLMRIDLRKVASLLSVKEVRGYLSTLGIPGLDFEEADFEFFSSSPPTETQAMLVLEKRIRYLAESRQ